MINPADLAYSSFMMCPPFAFSDNDQETHLAVRQWLDFYNLLSNTALVYVMPSKPHLPDQTFIADAGVILSHLKDSPVVISTFAAEHRHTETVVNFNMLWQFAFGTVTIAPHYFAGESDLKYLRENIYFIIESEQTTPNVADWFRHRYEMEVIPIRIADPNFQKLEQVLFPLASDKVIVNTGAIEREDLKKIEQVASILPLSPAIRSATSLVRVHRLLIGSSDISMLKSGDDRYDNERRKVDEIGKIAAANYFEPVFINLSAFQDRQGAAGSLVLHVNQLDFAPGRT